MKLRVVIADDERPARSFLTALLHSFPEVELVGEAASGAEAVELIHRHRPDLALLDLQMPEVDGLSLVSLIRPDCLPRIAFVTAYDEYAVKAFELNAIDYLLKPVEKSRLEKTIQRAMDKLDRGESEAARLGAAIEHYAASRPAGYLERIPIRQREEIILLPVEKLASIVAEGEILVLTTTENQRHYLTCRLKDLAARLDPSKFIRLSRGALARIDQIDRLSPMPGGAFLATLHNRQELQVSRMQARLLRDQWLKI